MVDCHGAEAGCTSRGRLLLFVFLGLLLALSPAAAADYETVSFNAAHLGGMAVSFNVIVPQDYATSTRRFPVLYLLHGYSGHYSDWVTHSRLTEYARSYEEIIVMPEDENGWYVDNYANPRLGWQSYLIQDLIPYVDRHYRTVASRDGRAVAGLSMGGYGAILLGLKYRQMFAAAASLSGALSSAEPAFEEALSRDSAAHQALDEDFGPLNNPARRTDDPFELVREIPVSELPSLYLSVGSSDGLLGENRDFVALLAELRIPYRYCEVPGKHEWPVWDSQIQRVLALQAPVIGALPKSAGQEGRIRLGQLWTASVPASTDEKIPVGEERPPQLRYSDTIRHREHARERKDADPQSLKSRDAVLPAKKPSQG